VKKLTSFDQPLSLSSQTLSLSSLFCSSSSSKKQQQQQQKAAAAAAKGSSKSSTQTALFLPLSFLKNTPLPPQFPT